MDTIILIPAYNPTPAMAETAKQLCERGFTVLIVNDGSSPEYSDIFLESEKYAEIIGYEKNGGKGAALKYGFRHIMTHMRSQFSYVITCDADGQHAVGDIIKVNAFLHEKGNIVVGSRDFSGSSSGPSTKLPAHISLHNVLVLTISVGRNSLCLRA